MNDFHYVDNALWCESLPVNEIAKEVGTPLYLYSYKTLQNHFRTFDAAFWEFLTLCASRSRLIPTSPS